MARARAALAAVALLASCVAAGVQPSGAQYVVEKAALRVVSPTSAAKKQIESAMSDFGRPAYGSAVKGRLVYPPAWVGTAAAFTPPGTPRSADFLGCGLPGATGQTGTYSGSNTTQAYARHFPPSGLHKTFALLDRGECSFIEKVYNAQAAGAAGAILVDNIAGESLLTTVAPDADAQGPLYQLQQKISIPSVFVTKETGDMLKSLARAEAGGEAEKLLVTIDWTSSLNVTAGSVHAEYWTTSSQLHVSDHLEFDFEVEARDTLVRWQKEGHLDWVPHYDTVLCCASADSKLRAGAGILAVPLCDNYTIDPTINPECANDCINGGRYCLDDPDGDLTQGYSGRDIVMQNLREIAVREWGRKNHKPEAWWDFAREFATRCRMTDENFNEACAEETMAALDIPAEEVRTLMGPHSMDGSAADNPVLEAEIFASLANQSCDPNAPGCQGNVIYTPTLLINEDQYRGALVTSSILNALCGAYAAGTGPTECQGGFVNSSQSSGGSGGGSDSGGASLWVVIVVVVVSLAVFSLAGAILYRRYWKAQMNTEIRSIMANYMPLQDEGNGRPPRGVVSAVDGFEDEVPIA
jgi:hypothetical protein